MGDPVTDAALIGAAVAVAGTAYTVHAQKSAAEDAANSAQHIAAMQLADTNTIAPPDVASTASTQQSMQQQAATAGGTIMQGGITDQANQQRKSLIGS